MSSNLFFFFKARIIAPLLISTVNKTILNRHLTQKSVNVKHIQISLRIICDTNLSEKKGLCFEYLVTLESLIDSVARSLIVRSQ